MYPYVSVSNGGKLLIFEYSVDQSDIKQAGVEAVNLLIDQEAYRQVVDNNFKKGLKHFSYQVLRHPLEFILKS